MQIKGSVALVTGANRGLGLAFAKALLAAGATKVYAAARNPSGVDLAGVVPIQLDTTNADDIARVALECPDVTLLVNNAGISKGSSLFAADSAAAARAEFETNVIGPLELTKAMAPALARNGGGAVVNVLSILSWLSLPSSATYSASKAMLWSITNGLRAELAKQQTRMVALHVAFMDTDMTKGVNAPKASPADVVAQVLEALEAGKDEVFADDLTRKVHAGLSAGSYLRFPG